MQKKRSQLCRTRRPVWARKRSLVKRQRAGLVQALAPQGRESRATNQVHHTYRANGNISARPSWHANREHDETSERSADCSDRRQDIFNQRAPPNYIAQRKRPGRNLVPTFLAYLRRLASTSVVSVRDESKGKCLAGAAQASSRSGGMRPIRGAVRFGIMRLSSK